MTQNTRLQSAVRLAGDIMRASAGVVLGGMVGEVGMLLRRLRFLSHGTFVTVQHAARRHRGVGVPGGHAERAPWAVGATGLGWADIGITCDGEVGDWV
jgi:hypothetical protein